MTRFETDLGTRQAWYDNNYEGRKLRGVFTKLLKRFDKMEQDPNTSFQDLGRAAHILTIVAKTKGELSKPENEYLARLAVVESHLGINVRRVSGVLESK